VTVEPIQLQMTFIPFDLEDLVERLRRAFFPQLHGVIRCEFDDGPYLAHVRDLPYPGVRGRIFVNRALDRPDVPEIVMAAILKHELLHLVVPGEDHVAWVDCHPPEFWEAEDTVAPEIVVMWDWMKRTFGRRLWDDGEGAVIVRRRVRKGGWRRVRGR
jgi:hypothetical protein